MASVRSAQAFWSQPQRQPAGSQPSSPGGAAAGGSRPPVGPEPFMGFELQGLIRSIPFKKLALWGFVFVASYQLKEFFGVGRYCFFSFGAIFWCFVFPFFRSQNVAKKKTRALPRKNKRPLYPPPKPTPPTP